VHCGIGSPAAFRVRVWQITSRGWDPWTERPLPEVVRVAYPPRKGMDSAKWRATLEKAYKRFCAEVDSGEPTFIDPYAAEHPAEFFAVMSEAFFTESAVLARDWPELYAEFAMFYKQDPAASNM